MERTALPAIGRPIRPAKGSPNSKARAINIARAYFFLSLAAPAR